MNNHDECDEDENTSVTLSSAVDRYMARLERREPDRVQQRREMAYRRGYLQGWSEALDAIFGQLLEKGISQKDAYRAVARIENEVIMPWRNDLSISHHGFSVEKFLKPIVEEVDE